MYRVSVWVLLGVIAAALFGWILRGGTLDGPKVAGWTDLGTWGWASEGAMTTTAGIEKPAAVAKPAKEEKTVKAASDTKTAEKPAPKADEKKIAAAPAEKTAAKETATPAAGAPDAPKARESDAWQIVEDVKKGVDVEIKIPGWKSDDKAAKPAPAPEAKPAAKDADVKADANKADAGKGVPHDRPWPVATEVPNWGKVMKVPAPAAEVPAPKAADKAGKDVDWDTGEAKKAAAPAVPAGKGVPHGRPWPVATEVPNWGKVMKVPMPAVVDEMAAEAVEAVASVTAKAIDWPIADAPVKWGNVRIAAPEPEAAPAPAPVPSVTAKAIDWPIADAPVKWGNVRIAAPEPEEEPAPAPSVTAKAIDWPIADAPVKWGNVRLAAPEPEAEPAPAPSVTAKAIDWPIATESVTWTNVRAAAVEPEPAPEATPAASVTAKAIDWPIATEPVTWDNVRTATVEPPPPPAETERRKEMTVEQIACEDELRRIYASGTLLFKTGSAQLDSKSTETLNALAVAAKKCNKARIRVEGHTDDQGSNSFNQKLSERRAQAIVAYLAGAGVDKGMISAYGYGEERPVAPNSNEANRQKNRRIDFTVE